MKSLLIKFIINEAKKCIQEDNFEVLDYRQKNKDSLKKYGFTGDFLIRELIEELDEADFNKGPTSEQDPTKTPGDVYEFIMNINFINDNYNVDFFIKFKFEHVGDCKLVVISLHESEMYDWKED